METLRALPDLQGRRYGTVALGYDRIDQIRMEVSVLETLAAVICGCRREELTIPIVQAVLADIQTRGTALTDDDLDAARALGARELLARAVAVLPQPTSP